MNPDKVFLLIVLTVTLLFLWERWVAYLNARRFGHPPPPETADIYDPEAYRHHMTYKKKHYRLSLIQETLGFVLLILLLFTGAFAALDRLTASLTDRPVWRSLLYLAFLLTALFLFRLPFDYYAVFRIEQDAGFNRMRPALFWADKVKGWLLSLGLLVLVGWPVIALYYKYPDRFWWTAWAVVVLFTALFTLFYSDLIVPLFNKQTPLAPGPLRDLLEDTARRAGFRLRDIYVIDGSKRSTKANAYFTGFGPRKRIVLYDTLIQDLEPEEIAAVLAHEIGHYKKRHVWLLFLVSVLLTGLTFWLLDQALRSEALSRALGVEEPSFHTGLVAFALLYGVVELITSIATGALSRRFEFQADAYAARAGYAPALIRALKKLARKSYANLTPHPLYVRMYYSHPPLHERIQKLKYEK
ncbi:MAG: M48 family metallopeptidase [Chlorobi bacterium]|nr:M48 family metallopeptidase [Chlorobiota bacterium]